MAIQEWQVHSSASEAQKIVDIAVAARANQIENVECSVKDPDELEAKACAAALNRAKNLAEQTASHAGLKLGRTSPSLIRLRRSNGDSGDEVEARDYQCAQCLLQLRSPCSNFSQVWWSAKLP